MRPRLMSGLLRQLTNLKEFSFSSRSFASAATEVSTRATNFWTESVLKDLPDTSVDLELLRRHNSSFPYYKNQVVVGRIVGVERDHVAIYTGHKTLTKFAKKELHLSQLVKSRDASLRNGPRDFRIGDVMHFILEELQSPFGDIGLRVIKPSDDERITAVWREIEEHHARQDPLKGRILNSVNKGYCVGIAGMTAFLPYSLCTLLTASKVGVLQPFIIQRLNPETLSIVVADPQMVAQQKARNEHRLKRQAEREAASAEETTLQSKSLTQDRLRTLMDSVRLWQSEEEKRTGRLPRFPSALSIANSICWRRARKGGRGVPSLTRLQLAHVLVDLERQLPPKKYGEIVRQIEEWGIDTSTRERLTERKGGAQLPEAAGKTFV